MFLILGEVFKPIEFIFLGYFCIKSGVSWNCLPYGIPLIILGQILNSAFYKRLGPERVYYGTELGVTEPKILTGFPLDIGHSQYKGCILTLLGLFFF